MTFEGLQLGRYRLLRLIGRGASSEVYLAEDQKITRQVSVKVVLCEDSSSDDVKDAALLFQREAQTIAMLNHPNILPLFDFGEDVINGMVLTYLVTQYCAEGSLAAWLRQPGRPSVLPPHQVAHIIQMAASALEYAHDRQIIHRDVKPANFLVRSRKDTPGQPDLLLADFGVARFINATAKVSKTVRGTPIYMAPEQWMGSVEPATDQYALAVMAYEMLTGRPPFTGVQQQVMYQHIVVQAQPPSAYNPRITPAIDAVILRALAKAPADRFPTITEFTRAFQGAINHLSDTPAVSTSYTDPFMTIVQIPPPRVISYLPHPSDPSSVVPGVVIPSIIPGREIRTTLNISSTEALAGVSRTVILPDKRPVKVVVPAGAYDGQIMRVEGQDVSSSAGSQRETIIVMIAITPSTEPPVIEQIPGLPPSRVKWRPIILILLAMLVILGSVIGIFSFRASQSTTNLANATATASHSTAVASQPTAVASTTTTTQPPTAVPSVSTNPYDNGHWTQPSAVSLSANSAFNWDQVLGACIFAMDGYHVKGTSQGQACIARNMNFSNVTFQVQMTVASGQGGGILLLHSDGSAYYFRVNQDGTYALLGCTTPTSCNAMLTGGISSTITTGMNKPNLIAVVAKGNRIDLYVNGERVDSIDEPTSAHVQIGVVAEPASEVLFSNATVWTA